jgi:hypothetical protein
VATDAAGRLETSVFQAFSLGEAVPTPGRVRGGFCSKTRSYGNTSRPVWINHIALVGVITEAKVPISTATDDEDQAEIRQRQVENVDHG